MKRENYRLNKHSEIYFANQDMDVNKLIIESNKVEKIKRSNIKARQPGFVLSLALYNLHKLSDHFIEIFRKINRKYAIEEFMTNLIADQRCHLMSYNLILWELMAIMAPDEIKVDLFDLLCVRGCAFFQIYITPSGKVTSERAMRQDSMHRKPKIIEEIYDVKKRLQTFYRRNFDRKRQKSDSHD